MRFLPDFVNTHAVPVHQPQNPGDATTEDEQLGADDVIMSTPRRRISSPAPGNPPSDRIVYCYHRTTDNILM